MKLLVLLLLTLFNAATLRAEEATADWSKLRSIVQTEMRDLRIPGAAVVVIAENRVVFSEGFGLQDVASKRDVSSRTRFRIGSLTKMFTAATVLSLAAAPDAKLSLNLPIQNYLTSLPPRLGALTLDQLLRHEAGLVDRIDLKPLTDKDLFTEPERIFSYSSPGYSLIGQSAAAATGMSFEELLESTLFLKLGMTATSYESDVALDTVGYQLRRGRAVPTKFMTNDALRPAGFLWSSADDLALFAIAFMNGTLDQRITGAMMTPRAVLPGETRRYGYGSIIDQEGNDTVVYHMGDEAGGSSFLKMVPSKNCAVIVLTNMMGRLPRSMATALQLAGNVTENVAEETKASVLTDAEISQLLGEYDNSFGLRISRKRGGIVLGPPFPWYLNWIPLTRELSKFGPDRYGVSVPPSVSEKPIPVVAVRGERGGIDFLFMRGRAYKRVK